MIRKRVTMNCVGHNFKSAIKVIDRGNVYVSRYPDGVCILVNNRGVSREFKFIMFDPKASGVTRAEMNRDEFERMFPDLVMNLSREHYEFVENGDDMIEQFDSICTALMALDTGSYKGYRVRQLGNVGLP